MGDEVWHEVAESLGYTAREINGFSSCDNPIAAVIADYKCRGGMPHQFISALYKTGSPGNMTKQHMSSRSGPSRVMEERSGEFIRSTVQSQGCHSEGKVRGNRIFSRSGKY